jgi:adenylate kinase
VNLLLLGPQGSGKGTQAARIAAEYGLEKIETGRMLRDAIDAGSELGRRVEPIVNAGRLVPDELMNDLIEHRLETVDGFVMDGFPRTLAQGRALDALLASMGRDLDAVFFFDVPDATARARLLDRAARENRADDTPEAIDRRLNEYHEKTEPVVEHYRASGKLVPVHANRPVNEVFAEIQRALDQVAAR